MEAQNSDTSEMLMASSDLAVHELHPLRRERDTVTLLHWPLLVSVQRTARMVSSCTTLLQNSYNSSYRRREISDKFPPCMMAQMHSLKIRWDFRALFSCK